MDHLVRYGVAYAKQAEDSYAEQVRERTEQQLPRRAKELGNELMPIEPPATPALAEPAATRGGVGRTEKW